MRLAGLPLPLLSTDVTSESVVRTRTITWDDPMVGASAGRAATAETRLTDRDGKLYAHATTTCMIFRPEQGGRA